MNIRINYLKIIAFIICSAIVCFFSVMATSLIIDLTRTLRENIHVLTEVQQLLERD